jgi:hypothetical protein
MSREALLGSFRRAFVIWLGYGILLVPALIIAHYVDRALDAAVDGSRAWAAGRDPIVVRGDRVASEVTDKAEQLRGQIDDRFSWSDPRRYAGNRLVDETEQAVTALADQQVTVPAPLYVRAGCGVLEFVLQILHWQLIFYVVYIVVRSFSYVYARVYASTANELVFCISSSVMPHDVTGQEQ